MTVLSILTLLALAGDPAVTPPSLRLPADLRPVRQAVDLTLDPTLETFSGSAEIDLELKQPLRVLWLNAAQLAVKEATLRRDKAVTSLRVVPGGDDFVGFLADAPLAAGPARLHVVFDGTVSRRDNEGIFTVQEQGAWYLFTQFEAIQARRAFPCFDEPGFKIPWDVTLRVPHGLVALSNSPAASTTQEGERDVVRYAPTPPLPSYLVAFVVGPFEIVPVAPSGRKHTPTRLVVPRGRGSDTAWARESTPQIVGLLEDYFDRPYPYDKLDQVAIPGVYFAMEHPGLVTYSQTLMVQRPADETISSRRTWASIAAHELAHQWFGDLVTMAWWDDTWLNESFASWLGEKTTDRLRPEWGVAIDRASNRSSALEADSVASARRIRQPITSKDDIYNAFDGVTYGKGEAVLEMIEAWLGEEVFRRGVRSYVERHAWGNATATDFSAALSAVAGGEVDKVLAAFLDQTGAPVLTAELRCDGRPRLLLSQRPYQALGSPAEPKTWSLPVCARVAGRDRPACTVLSAPTGEIRLDGLACPDWYSANAGAAGYYRTQYRGAEARQVLEKDKLTTAERVALVGDVDALTATGDVSAADALQLVPLLAKDPDRHVVSASVGLVLGLEALVPDPLLPRFAALVRGSYGPRARSLGWAVQSGENDDVRLLRRSLLQVTVGTGRDPQLGHEAIALVGRWLGDPTALDPELVTTAIGAASAWGGSEMVSRLSQEVVRTTERERRERMLAGLGSAREPGEARELLALTLDERLDPRESITVLFGLSRKRETRRTAFDFLKTNYDALAARLPHGEFSPAVYFPWVGAGLCAEDTRAEIDGFFGPRAAALTGGPRVLTQVLESVDQCIARKRLQQPPLAAYLESLRD